jgi:hypothetical protein
MSFQQVVVVFLGSAVLVLGQTNLALLWTRWLTNDSYLSYWDNSNQIRDETNTESEHPYSFETRWDITRWVVNSPPESYFVLEEIGSEAICGYNCTIMVFGVSDSSLDSVHLDSYSMRNDYMKDFVSCVHKQSIECTLDYNLIAPDGFRIDYNYTNTSTKEEFLGWGSGKIGGGMTMTINETISSSFSLVLELIYDSSGHSLTPYDTPIKYEIVGTF